MNTLLLAAVLLFPTVHGSTVATKDYVLPQSLGGKANIVIVSFGQDQRILTDTWLPLVRNLAEQPDVQYKEVIAPSLTGWLTQNTVDAMYSFRERDPGVYENTVTVYPNRVGLMRGLHLPTTHTIYALLLDQSGYVRWRADGSMTPLEGEQLREAVALLLKS
jgi:hypothetical protein